MEDSWICIEDDSSSHYSLTDSDRIDSETEAELYSKIHYDQNLSCTNSENFKESPSTFSVCSPFNNNIFCIDDERNTSTPMRSTSEHPFSNQNTCNNFTSGKRKSSEMDADSMTVNKLSLPKKNKSNSVKDLPCTNFDSNDSENANDPLQFKSSNIQNKRTMLNSNLKNKSDKKTDTVLINSSDSDSDIWIEPSTADKSDLKINLLNDADIVFLSSSSSDDEPDVSSPFMKKTTLKNLSMPNIRTEENSKGLWHINFEDLHRSKKHSRRYHENIDATCSNCNRKGHTLRMCPSPRVIKCFICGGNHIGSRCSRRMCSNCYTCGHDRRNCFKTINREFCNLCNMEGHTKGNCPDLWRRYHLSTANSPQITKGKQVQQDTDLYCWKCGKCGHFGGVCPLSYLSKSSISTWPCVISYNNPKNFLKERLSFLRKYPHLSLVKQNKNLSNIRNTFNISSGSNEENKTSKKGRRKKQKADLRFNKVQGIVKESNFPRTPKKSPIKCSTNFKKFENKPISPELLLKQQLNKLKKTWIKQRKRANLQANESQTIKDDIPKTNLEDNLPESIKFQAQMKFKKWKKNQMNKTRKLLKRNISKVKMEDTESQDTAVAKELDLYVLETIILPEEV